MTPLQSLVCGLLFLGVKGQDSPLLRLEPQNPLLPGGGSLMMNCSTSCQNPEFINLETALWKEPVGTGLRWAAFQLRNVTGDTQVFCSGLCSGSQMSDTSDITVYRFPQRVELAPLPSWHPVGRNLTLRCQVLGGEPRAHLTVVLLRGTEELRRQPVKGDPRDLKEVKATMLVNRRDHGASFSCRTELDLRPLGLQLFQNSSASRQLQTFVLPMTPPHLQSPPILEVGTWMPVSCTLDGLFPASEAQVQMTLGDQFLNTTVSSHGDTVRARAMVIGNQEEVREIVCNVSLGGRSVAARENVTVFRFLGPILSLSETNVTEGSTVNVTCTSGPQVQVILKGAPTPPPGNPAQLQLQATEEDDGHEFFCNATLKVGGVTLHRDTTVQLRVLYGPKIDRDKCPQHTAWKDRTVHVLQCQARGNPSPKLWCLQTGSSYEIPIGTPFRVNLRHSGTYNCKAASPRGSDTLLMVIEVHDRSSRLVTIIIGVLAILGLLTIAVALQYIFGKQKRSGSYHVRNPSTSVPLRPLQVEDLVGEEAS